MTSSLSFFAAKALFGDDFGYIYVGALGLPPTSVYFESSGTTAPRNSTLTSTKVKEIVKQSMSKVISTSIDYKPYFITYYKEAGKKPRVEIFKNDSDPNLACVVRDVDGYVFFKFFGSNYYFYLQPGGRTIVRGCKETMQLMVIAPNEKVLFVKPSKG